MYYLNNIPSLHSYIVYTIIQSYMFVWFVCIHCMLLISLLSITTARHAMQPSNVVWLHYARLLLLIISNNLICTINQWRTYQLQTGAGCSIKNLASGVRHLKNTSDNHDEVQPIPCLTACRRLESLVKGTSSYSRLSVLRGMHVDSSSWSAACNLLRS